MLNQADNITAIREFLDQPDAVIFVGSGLSVWSGLPTWEVIIRKLIDLAALKGMPCQLAEEFLVSRQLLDAADALQLTPTQISEALRKELGFSTTKPHEVHSLLVKLGPQRFVTTNFDTLLEQQLGLQGALGQFRTVSSRQVAELADIVKASADQFIFKPHGDLADAESLVLSSRDYDRLIGGETNQVRRALETILVSRPALFVGYGFRDPDTRFILRTLVDRYVGNVGHFAAIMPDATIEHQNYWWERYRIRVFSYATFANAAGGRDHRDFLSLLRSLAVRRRKEKRTRHQIALDMNAKLGDDVLGQAALTRYAARLIRPEPARKFPIRAWFQDAMRTRRFSSAIANLHRSSVTELLQKCPQSFILSGPAGCGKSFAITEFMSACGRALIAQDKLSLEARKSVIPLLLDARLYNGSFRDLEGATLPKELDLALLSRDHEVVVIIDSIDEMPSAELDSARWRADLESFTSRFEKVRIVYCSRRSDLAGRHDLPVFYIRGLQASEVADAMLDVGTNVSSLSSDFKELLQTPFLLSLAQRQLPRRSSIRSAPALLESFIKSGVDKLGARSAGRCVPLLARIAEFLTDSGRETISIREFDRHVANSPEACLLEDLTADGLVAVGIMVSEIDAHVRFVHRTVTEYLAAQAIFPNSNIEDLNLYEKLSTHRWDNSIAWAVSGASESDARELLRMICNVDRSLAYKIAAFSEISTSKLWVAFLESILENPPTDDEARDIFYSIDENVTLPREVVPQLKKLLQSQDIVGGWAVSQYASFATEQELRDLIDWITGSEVDYNFASFAGAGIAAALSRENLSHLLSVLEEKVDSIVALQDSPHPGYVFSEILEALSSDNVLYVLSWGLKKGVAVRELLCRALRDCEGREVDRFLLKQLDSGIAGAAFSIHMRIEYQRERVAQALVPKFTVRRLRRIIDVAMTGDENVSWQLALLRSLASRDMQWSAAMKELESEHPSSLVRRSLKVIHPWASRKTKERFISKMIQHPSSASPLEKAALAAIKRDDVVIADDIILSSLASNGRVALEVVSELFGYGRSQVELNYSNLDRWIDVLGSLGELDSVGMSWISTHLAEAFADKGRQKILGRANKADDAARDFVLGSLVLRMPTVTTDDLTETAKTRLLDLYLSGELEPWPSVGQIATERFIFDEVLPLAKKNASDASIKDAILIILQEAGQRHDRRYFAPWQIRE